MPLVQRVFRGPADWAHMAAVVQAQPEEHLHVVDLPYRLCSWAFDQPANCALWEDAGGRVLAWAVLQSPFWTIDYALHPSTPPALLDQLLAWAEQRIHALQGTAFARPIWFINGFKGHRHQPIIEGFGFRSQADVPVDPWTKVLFQRPVAPLPDAPALPPGFQIHPLDGAAEVPAYVALHRAVFQSESMTGGWRERALSHPAYQPELDLVLTDPAGRLAGFCIGWFTSLGPNKQPAGQIEPLGIRADLRGQGLARALVSECLGRMAAAGATALYVETDNYRDAAFNFYQAAGFQIARDVIVYRKDYAAGE